MSSHDTAPRLPPKTRQTIPLAASSPIGKLKAMEAIKSELTAEPCSMAELVLVNLVNSLDFRNSQSEHV